MSFSHLVRYVCDCCKKTEITVPMQSKEVPEQWAFVEVRVLNRVLHKHLCPNCAQLHLVAIGVDAETWKRAVDSFPDSRV